jgi:hypothetical protein
MAKMDDIKKTFEQGVSIAREGVAYAAERAEDLSLAAALRLRIFGLRRRIERHYAELGAAVYFLLDKKADVSADAAVKKHVKDVKALEADVNELFAQLAEVSHKKAPGKGRAAPPRGKKAGSPREEKPRPTGR